MFNEMCDLFFDQSILVLGRFKMFIFFTSQINRMEVIEDIIAANFTPLVENNAVRFRFLINGRRMTQFEAIDGLVNSPAIREAIRLVLVDPDLPESYFFECPPVLSLEDAHTKDFEFVIIPAPELENCGPARPDMFSEHFLGLAPFVAFLSLNKDSVLVSPKPSPENLSFGQHLCSYMRNVSAEEGGQFLEYVGKSLLETAKSKKVYLSTSGLGVYWLHMRLDSKPKYYHHLPYRKM